MAGAISGALQGAGSLITNNLGAHAGTAASEASSDDFMKQAQAMNEQSMQQQLQMMQMNNAQNLQQAMIKTAENGTSGVKAAAGG